MATATAKPGDRVSVRYTGRLKDGTVFDSNMGEKPLEFTVGKGEVIPGFDGALDGLTVGAKKRVEIPPEDAYGPRDEELVIPVRAEIFGDASPEPGVEVALRGRDGTVFNGKVARIEGETVHVDLNHPLAGETLVFDVELLNIGA